MKIKRKELEEDFSDFSLSSPATKIRRLDVELPPIMEEIEEDKEIDELGSVPGNEERAIVLFKPVETLIMHSPWNYSVSPEIISRVKSNFRSNQSSFINFSDDEVEVQKNNPETSDRNLAVVPWVPSQVSPAAYSEALQTEEPELMESEEMEVGDASMDIEEDNSSIQNTPGNELAGRSEGLHQWRQPHCMSTQLSHSTSTPIVWYR